MIMILLLYLSLINFEYLKVGDNILFMYLMYDYLYRLNLWGNVFIRWIGFVCNVISMCYFDFLENFCFYVLKVFFKELIGFEILFFDKNYLVYLLRND